MVRHCRSPISANPTVPIDFRSGSSGFRDTTGSGAEYDEYEGADNFEEQPQPYRSASASTSRSATKPQPPPKTAAKVEKPVEKAKEVNLFDFDDDPVAAPTLGSAPAATAAGDGGLPLVSAVTDDFQMSLTTFKRRQACSLRCLPLRSPRPEMPASSTSLARPPSHRLPLSRPKLTHECHPCPALFHRPQLQLPPHQIIPA